MVTVTLRYYTPISDVTGKKEDTLSFSGPVSLGELIQAIIGGSKNDFSRYFYDREGVFRPQCLVLVNGKYSVELTRILFDGDEISFIPPVAGG